MKRILLYLFMFSLLACEKDETKVMLSSDVTPPKINVPADNASIIVTAASLADNMDISWTATGYGVTTEVNYTLEVASGCADFADAIVLASTTDTKVSMSMADFNAKLMGDLKLAPHQASALKLRVSSTIKDNLSSRSDIITITVTPYSDAPIALWLGTAGSAARIFATGETSYEGYARLEGGTSFKFVNNRTCANKMFGAAGAGTLTADGGADVAVSETGYYKINVDTEKLTYKVELANWGLIGSSTAGGWNSSTPMTYNENKGVWEATASLQPGALKFRANDGWGINYGTPDINKYEEKLVFDGESIDIKEAGYYNVTLDFSQNTAPYQYRYTVKLAGEVPEPTKLWLPGSYQGWSPSTAPIIYSVSDVAYEGFVYIPVGAGFKFTSAPDWDHINYGDSGTPGVLTTDGAKDGLSINTGGFYRFKVNTTALTYAIDLVNSMGIVGPATQGGSDAGWNTSVPMTYNQAENVWTITTDLAVGAVKFRANNDWAINFGPADSNALEGFIISDGSAAVDIKQAGNYTITADFSRLKSPYQYTYSIKKN